MKQRVTAIIVGLAAASGAAAAPMATLVGRAILPALTFTDGPTSGLHLGPEGLNGQSVPFVGRQPVQGFSALLTAPQGRFLVLPDNGFGAMEISADFLLRVYEVEADASGEGQRPGAMRLTGGFNLRDPDHHLPFVITHEFSVERLLTGADLDPESMQRAPDGTFWFGDEFGPFLIHTDASGKILAPPYELPDPNRPGLALRSPQNPLHEETAAFRLLNALHAHGRRLDDTPSPVLSPAAALLVDLDPTTVVSSRHTPPPESGLAVAASEIIDTELLRKAGYDLVPYGVDDPARLAALLKLGIKGVITAHPERLAPVLAAFDADGDGRGGDLLQADGSLDASRFDLHAAGAADLAPGSPAALTLALDNLVTTLEIRLAPAALADALAAIDAYTDFYASGLGRTHPLASQRAANAARVHLSLGLNDDLRARQAPAAVRQLLASAVATLQTRSMESRVAVRSFDLATLLLVQEMAPRFAVVFAMQDEPDAGGSNLQPDASGRSPWLAGRMWPYRLTAATYPFRLKRSGGLESVALSADGRTLYPMLQLPMPDGPQKTLMMFAFDLAAQRYVPGVRGLYVLEARGESAADFIMLDAERGLVIERDNTEGDPTAFKKIYEVTLGLPGSVVAKREAADLMAIADPEGRAGPGLPGDIGVGPVFQFPFELTEGLVAISPGRIAVVNDNNFPFNIGRHVGQRSVDDTELIVIDLPPRP